MSLDADTLDRLRDAVGGAALTEPQDQEPYLREWRDRWVGRSPAILRPGSTDEVSEVLRLAFERDLAIVPQGGNTGLVGGQIPESGEEIVVSLGRMNRIREVDPLGATITVEAGVTLQAVQEAADAAGLFFPLSIGSEGTAQIGGVLSTNAGGTAVLAYGSARDLVLGLEVVLADGRVWSGLNHLRKDNTGYDLKHLFVGVEGTLGLITAAVLKLFPKPRARETVFLGLGNVEAAVTLFGLARGLAGAELTSFELMPRLGVEMSCRHASARDPLARPHDWYVLMEISSPRENADLSAVTEAIF
ncbi:MAG: FAD-binding oxidoreductase, partial [Pseudomonadota bacterium]